MGENTVPNQSLPQSLPNPQSQTNPKNKSSKKVLYIIVPIIVVALLVFLLLGNKIFSSALSIFLSHKYIPLKTFVSYANRYLANKNYNITYQGFLGFNASSISASIKFTQGISINFTLGIAKYYNITRFYFNTNNASVSGSPITIGRNSFIVITNKSTVYSCSTINSSKIYCIKQPSLSNINISNVNFSIYINSVNSYSYNGVSCELIKGNYTNVNISKLIIPLINKSNTTSNLNQLGQSVLTALFSLISPMNITYNICVSNNYLPIFMNASLSMYINKTKVGVEYYIKEISYSNYVSPSISVLPGPVINLSSLSSSQSSTPPNITGFSPFSPWGVACLSESITTSSRLMPSGLYLFFANNKDYVRINSVIFSSFYGLSPPRGIRFAPINLTSTFPTANQTIPTYSEFGLYINTTCPSVGYPYSANITITYLDINTSKIESTSGHVSGNGIILSSS